MSLLVDTETVAPAERFEFWADAASAAPNLRYASWTSSVVHSVERASTACSWRWAIRFNSS